MSTIGAWVSLVNDLRTTHSPLAHTDQKYQTHTFSNSLVSTKRFSHHPLLCLHTAEHSSHLMVGTARLRLCFQHFQRCVPINGPKHAQRPEIVPAIALCSFFSHPRHKEHTHRRDRADKISAGGTGFRGKHNKKKCFLTMFTVRPVFRIYSAIPPPATDEGPAIQGGSGLQIIATLRRSRKKKEKKGLAWSRHSSAGSPRCLANTSHTTAPWPN